MNHLPKIAITMGDPGGIGAEIIVKTLDHFADPKAVYIIVGIEKILSETAGRLDKKLKIAREIKPDEIPTTPGLYFLSTAHLAKTDYDIGKPSARNGKIAIQIINTALQMALGKKVDAIVTAPVSKQAINEAGVKFIGHTEYLAQPTRTRHPVMMFVTDRLKVALLTRHISYKKVLLYLTIENIVTTLQVCHNALKNDFNLVNPRIAVCGLNPHAGEDELMGKEEKTIIQPALRFAREEGINCTGPFPADSIFGRAMQGEFDLVLALYHDQGLIPIKTTSHFAGANVTLGLPFVRTSVIHGPAFDITGKGVADATSLKYALQIAFTTCQQRTLKTL